MHDLELAGFTQGEAADVCVVGAGAAGITLALKLLRAGRSVVLAESGGLHVEDASQELSRGTVDGQPHTGIHAGRFRAWGGTTTRWGGQVLELRPIDFVRRAWVPGSGWPMAKDDLTSAYEEALRVEGLQAALREDTEVWAAAGSSAPVVGGALESYVTRWCPEPNFARMHGREITESAGATVLLHANLVDVRMNGDRVRSCVFRSLNGNTAEVVAREFVLAVGAMETSRLLLNFEERYGAAWNPGGHVGVGFHDHVDCDCAGVVPRDRAGFIGMFSNVAVKGLKYHPKVRLCAEAQEAGGVLNVAGAFVFHEADADAVAEVKFTGKRLLRRAWGDVHVRDVIDAVRRLPLLMRMAWAYAVRHRVYVDPRAAVSLRVHCEQQPGGEGRVSLGDECDALGLRRLQLRWAVSDLELKTIRAFVATVTAELQTKGIADVRPVHDLQDDAALRARCDDGLHHMGGAAMSRDVGDGVVDTELRLHGMTNFSVCSAAVFPTGGFSNPTHTLIALAVRLADRLAAATAGVR